MLSLSILNAGLLLSWGNYASAKAVFAHYMVGTVTEAHAHQDIDDAIAMGLDAFALNVGDASQTFVRDALSDLFGYAEYRNFKLFISMDIYASGDACANGHDSCKGPYDYQWIWDAHKKSPAYFQVDGKPLISTFSSGGWKWTGSQDHLNTSWLNWKQSLAYDMFFMPDFDETLGYYEADPGWWAFWGNVVDGLFSWEAAWPARRSTDGRLLGGHSIGDITVDEPVLKGTHDRSKKYMMCLSTLQYKNAYGANVYRAGDLNLITRMYGILNMADKPDFIQIATWNDGPESHYIGNLWYEQNHDAQPNAYANAKDWPHSGWQPIITSFAHAYRNSQGPSEMAPQNGDVAVGAAWYKTIMSNSISCPNDPHDGSQTYYNKPSGFGEGADALYWSIVMAPGATGYKVNVITGGHSATQQLNPGLNSGSSSGFNTGGQRLELIDPSGKLVMSASGGLCVVSDCPDAIYNENLQVMPLVAGSGLTGSQACRKHAYFKSRLHDLGNQATCTDLENYQASVSNTSSEDATVVTADMWDMVNTTQYLEDWLSKWHNDGYFQQDFASHYSLLQSESSCSVEHGCGKRYDCGDLGKQADEPGSGPGYMIMLAFNNVNQMLSNLFNTIYSSQADFSALTAYYTDTYDTNYDGKNPPILQELFGALSTAILVGGAIIDAPAAAAGAALAAGIFGAVSAAIDDDNTQDTLATMATMEKTIFNSMNHTRDGITTIYDNLVKYAKSAGTGDFDLPKILDHGAWVNFRDHAFLDNTSPAHAQIQSIYDRHMEAAVINVAWHQQRVWVQSYPMSEDDFNNKYPYAGNGDYRLRHYYNGRGYYFQSVFPQNEDLAKSLPRVRNPPGWAEAINRTFDLHGIIESSAKAYDAYGNGYNIAENIEVVLDAEQTVLQADSVFLPGIFNLAMCYLEPSNKYTPNVDAFLQTLSGPGALRPADEKGQYASLCYCLNQQDMNGKIFQEFIDVGGWAEGNDPACGDMFPHGVDYPKSDN